MVQNRNCLYVFNSIVDNPRGPPYWPGNERRVWYKVLPILFCLGGEGSGRGFGDQMERWGAWAGAGREGIMRGHKREGERPAV